MKINSSFLNTTLLTVFLLSVSACGGGGGGSDTPTPSANVAPTANAGTDETVTSESNVVLSGLASTDSDGTIASFSWIQTGGSSVTLSDSDTAQPSFSATVTSDTTFTFELTVTDDDGAPATDTVIITVTAPVVTGLTAIKDSNWTVEGNLALNFNSVAFNETKYIAAGYLYLGESTDGENWTEIETVYAGINWTELAVNGNSMVAIPHAQGSFSGVAMTTDGSSWQVVDSINTADCSDISSISHDGSQFVGLFSGNAICTSSDGSSWQHQSTQPLALSKITFGASKYAALISGGLITLDSLDSTASAVPLLPVSSSGDLTDLIFENGMFVGIRSGEIIYSSNGIDWSAVSSSAIPANIKSISYSLAKGFVAISEDTDPNIFASTDGAVWTSVGSTDLPQFACNYCFITNGTTETLIVSFYEIFYTSADQVSWASVTPATAEQLHSPFSYNGAMYAANAAGALSTSSDNGTSWTVISDSSVNFINWVFHDGSQFIAQTSASGSSAEGISYSADGISWINAISYGSNALFGASVKVATTTFSFVSNGDSNEDRNRVLSSDDGINYQVDDSLYSVLASSLGSIEQAVTNGTDIIAITANTIVSNAGGSWAITGLNVGSLTDIIWSGTHFVVTGAYGLLVTSTDGLSWTTQSWINNSATITDVLVVGSNLYATDSSGIIASSVDNGVNWVELKDFSSSGNVIAQLAHDGTSFFGFGRNAGMNTATLATSTDGVLWLASSALFDQATIPDSHIHYDMTSARFESAHNAGTDQVYASDNAATWALSSTMPTDSAFSYLATQTALEGLGFDRIHFVGGTPDTYTSGNIAYSEDGQNWLLRSDLVQYHFLDYTPSSGIFVRLGSGYQVQTSTDGINFTDATVTGLASGNQQFNYIEYSNGQYVGINVHQTTAIPGIYTSADGSNWSLITETDLGLGAFNMFGLYSRIVDIEYDSTQYLLLFNDSDYVAGLSKGIMILTSSDLQSFELHETGIKTGSAQDLILESGGYKIVGGSLVATHAAY